MSQNKPVAISLITVSEAVKNVDYVVFPDGEAPLIISGPVHLLFKQGRTALVVTNVPHNAQVWGEISFTDHMGNPQGYDWWGDHLDTDLLYNMDYAPLQVTVRCGYYVDQIVTETDRVEFTVYPAYSLVISVNDLGMGTTNPLPNEYLVRADDSVDVRNIPKTGFMLDRWILDDADAGRTATITVPMDNDHTLEAFFKAIPGFVISANPATLTITQGGFNTSNITITSQNGYNENVTLTVAVTPQTTDIATSMTPSQVTPPPNGSVSSILRVNVGATATPRSYSITVSATGITQSRTVNISLAVLPSAPPCDTMPDQATCEANGCHWYNGSCHAAAPTCDQLNNQADCTANGCYWYDGACHSSPQPTCDQILDKATCTARGCFWYNGACHPTAPTCDQLSNQADCVANSCFWWSDNTCHATAEPGTPDFTIVAAPADLYIHPSASDESDINLDSVNGFSGVVGLAVDALPSGFIGTATLSDAQVTPPGQSILTVTADAACPVGDYIIIVTGTSGALSHQAQVTVHVTTVVNTASLQGMVRGFMGTVQAGLAVSIDGDETTTNAHGQFAFSELSLNTDYELTVTPGFLYDAYVAVVNFAEAKTYTVDVQLGIKGMIFGAVGGVAAGLVSAAILAGLRFSRKKGSL